MSKFDLKDKLDNSIYNTYNLFSDILFHLNPSVKKILKNNLEFKDKHQGERCYILGTGPSLKSLKADHIDLLRKEVVFGVNSFYKAEVVSSLVPKYYALMDNLYWEQWSHTFYDVVEKYGEKSPVFITDLRAKNLSEEALPEKKHIYIYSKKYPVKEMSERLDENIFAAMNVVSYSILVAMYMGFKDIYILGCDYNAFATAGHGHAYDDKSEVDQVDYNLAFYLKFYWITTEFHYLISKLAKKKGISIINITPGSLLDAYPRKSIDNVLG